MQTVQGKPIKINKEWWRARYGMAFPDILDKEYDSFLDTCIQDIYSLFAGIPDLWDYLDRTVYENKTQMCYGLLVAWYIADLFPDLGVGIMSTGGIPLKAKRIGNTSIQFGDTASSVGSVNNADLLNSLKSNSFGAKAYLMIKTSGRINTFLRH